MKRIARHEELLTPREAAGVLGIGVNTLRNWAVKGQIAAVRTVAGRRRYQAGDVERLLNEGKGNAS